MNKTIKKFLIWFHRRRAISHEAKAAGNPFPYLDKHKTLFHNTWSKWHYEQLKRLKNK